MIGKCLAAVVLAFLPIWAAPLFAQENPLGSEAEPAFVVVEGLSLTDLLNVRATASPTGLLLNRVQNGTLLKSFGCTPVNGYDWCRVEGVDDPGIKGWTPARYLFASGAAPPATETPEAVAETLPDPVPIAPAEAAPARQTGPTNMDAALADAVRAVGETAAASAAARPPEAPPPVGVAAEPVPRADASVAQAAQPTADAPAPTPVSAANEAAPEAAAPEAGMSATATPIAWDSAPPPAAPAPQPASATVSAAEESAPSAPLPQASLTILSPAVLVLLGFPMAFMAAMAAIASFGSFTFSTPFERAELAA